MTWVDLYAGLIETGEVYKYRKEPEFFSKLEFALNQIYSQWDDKRLELDWEQLFKVCH